MIPQKPGIEKQRYYSLQDKNTQTYKFTSLK